MEYDPVWLDNPTEAKITLIDVEIKNNYFFKICRSNKYYPLLCYNVKYNYAVKKKHNSIIPELTLRAIRCGQMYERNYLQLDRSFALKTTLHKQKIK